VEKRRGKGEEGSCVQPFRMMSETCNARGQGRRGKFLEGEKTKGGSIVSGGSGILSRPRHGWIGGIRKEKAKKVDRKERKGGRLDESLNPARSFFDEENSTGKGRVRFHSYLSINAAAEKKILGRERKVGRVFLNGGCCPWRGGREGREKKPKERGENDVGKTSPRPAGSPEGRETSGGKKRRKKKGDAADLLFRSARRGKKKGGPSKKGEGKRNSLFPTVSVF